jgi:polysaccharide biosynthesis/export protein
MLRSILHAFFGLIAVAAVSVMSFALSPSISLADSPESSAAAQQNSPSNYIIGPGDMLQVFVWRNPSLSVTVPVRPDGKISTPLVENMVAVGKTPSQLARDMEKVLSVYVRSPEVNIIVQTALGKLTEVNVIGQVAKPGSFPYHKGMTVLDALNAAGGLTEFAAGNRAKIVRQVDGHERDIRVKLQRLMEKGDLSQNLLLEPRDVIVVPQSLF